MENNNNTMNFNVGKVRIVYSPEYQRSVDPDTGKMTVTIYGLTEQEGIDAFRNYQRHAIENGVDPAHISQDRMDWLRERYAERKIYMIKNKERHSQATYTQEKSEIFLTELLRQLKDGLWIEMRDEALKWKEKEE